tara:strand:+ start:1605 stop:2918 length:1314 start_codon:yes stop_codon:yes gene_type:complete
MKISIFGLGYVGAVTAACLSKIGHKVVGVDIEEKKVDAINQGKSPLQEQGLEDLICEQVNSGSLYATCDSVEAVNNSEVSIICVGTPSSKKGKVIIKYLENVCGEIAEAINKLKKEKYTLIVRSTCPPDVHEKLKSLIENKLQNKLNKKINYICHPEFLREGTSLKDFFNPSVTVFGIENDNGKDICLKLYPKIDSQKVFCSIGAASMIKYANNAFHATKITFANEIGILSKKLHLDSREIMEILCKDNNLNISEKYLRPGAPFGGSCLPKDLLAINDKSSHLKIRLPLIDNIINSNEIQISNIVKFFDNHDIEQNIGIIGIAFKKGTDDTRESPMIEIASQLVKNSFSVKMFDYVFSLDQIIGINKGKLEEKLPNISGLLVNDFNSIIEQSSALIIGQELSPNDIVKLNNYPDITIFDLIGLKQLEKMKNYHGLYW